MSIYIKGVEMPESCGQCPCFHAEHPMYCQAVKYSEGHKLSAPYAFRPNFCPLVPVPPHGRLMDADALMQQFAETGGNYDEYNQKKHNSRLYEKDTAEVCLNCDNPRCLGRCDKFPY